MKKRLNVKLVVRLVVGTIVVGVAVQVLHMVQMRREAGALRAHAQQAHSEGQLDEARQYYRRYLGYIPDDYEARGEMALILCDLAEEPDANNVIRRIAMEQMEKTLQRDPSNSEVRRRLAHYEVSLGRFSDAREHVEYLLKDSPNDAELHLLKGRCHVAMEEKQKARDELRVAIELDKSQIEAYRLLAHLALRESDGPSEQAEQVLDEMVAANPDSHEVYLVRASYFAGAQREEEAAEAVQHALEHGPDEADVLYQVGLHALRKEQIDEARKHLLRGIEIHPEEARFYHLLSICERSDNQLPKAIEYLKQGIATLPENAGLLAILAEVQLEGRDVEAAESTIKTLSELNVAREVLDLLTARVRAGEGRWVEARQILEPLRPRVIRNQALSKGVNMLLGECYRRLGKPELQIEALRRALSLGPNTLEAKRAHMGLAAAYQSIGQPDEARKNVAQAARDGDLSVMLKLIALDMSQILAQPEESRDWTRMERMLKQFDEALQEDVPQAIRAPLTAWQAEVLFQKDEQDAAVELLASHRAKHPEVATYWLAEAQLEARREQFERATAILDEAESHLSENRLAVALTRVMIHQTVGDEDALERLEAIAALGDGLTEDEHLVLLRRVAAIYRSLGDTDKAVKMYRRTLDIRKDDETGHLVLFEMAVLNEDESAVQQALAQIETVLGRDSFAWHFALGVHSVFEARQDSDQKDDLLAAAQGHVDEAEKLRPGMLQLVGLRAEIDDLRGNTDDAIEGYLRAVERGATQITHFNRLVGLLTKRGRLEEVDQLIERMPALVRASGLEAFAAGRVIQSRDPEDAEKYMRQSYDATAKDFRVHILFGSVMERRGKLQEAELAFRRAVKVGSGETASWVTLVRYLARVGKTNDAREVMDRAAQALPEGVVTLALARCNELLGDRSAAESLYLQALEARGEELVVLANVADYFSRTQQPEQSKRYLQHILEIGARDPEENQAVMAAARRAIAELNTRNGTYQDHLAMLELINQNARADGSLGPEDTWFKGQLLARRRDGRSRRQAIRILEELLEMRPSKAQARLILAQLYSSNRDNTEAREHLTRLCVDSPTNPAYKAMLINVLLASGAADEAADWLRTLEKQDPNASATADATARVRLKQGRIDEAIGALKSLLPAPPIPPSKLSLLRQVASALSSLATLAESDEHREQIVNAGLELLHQYVEADARGILALADYLARNPRLEETLQRCQQAIDEQFSLVQVSEVAVRAIRNRLGDAKPAHFDLVEGWLERGIEEQPGSADLLVQMAELQDMKEDYDASEQYYRRVLPMSNLHYLRRAQVLNNLAFLLALRDKNYDEALEMVEEAIELAGPISDMLDTRAVVLLARGAVTSAISDLRQAVDDTPSGMKYFHLAHAYLIAKNHKAAADALNRAHEEGLTSDEVSPLERANYRKVLDAVGRRSADQPVRLPRGNRPLRAAS